MIKIRFIHENYKKFERLHLPFLLIRSFNDLDEYITWFFKEENESWMIDKVLEGMEILTGEIKQKGINNK